MDSDKTFGYFLLILGIAIMMSALFSAYLVFTGIKQPPKLFNIQKQTSSTTVAGIELQTPTVEVIPTEYLNQSGDLSFFMLFMFFTAYVGGKTSSLGINLIEKTKKTAT